MSAPRFSVVLLGEEPLLTQCGDLLIDLGHRVAVVATSAPLNMRWARANGAAVWRKDEVEAGLERERPDLLVSVTWPWLLSPRAIATARRIAINFHDGPLPRYAGMNGSAWALARGERTHAIVWHQLTAGLDEGDILKRRDVAIDARETSVSLHIKNAGAALEAFLELVNELEAKTEVATPQARDVERLVFSRHDRPAALAVLDVTQGAEQLERLVRACDFGPYPNSFAATKLVHRERAIVVDEVEIECPSAPACAGTVVRVDDRLVIACGTGALAVVRARTLEGAPLTPQEAARALGVNAGDVLTDDGAELRTRLSRAVAEAEPFHLRRLLQAATSDPSELPFQAPRTGADAGMLSVPIDAPPEASAPEWVALFERGASALVAAYAFVCASLCGRDHVALSCTLRRSADFEEGLRSLLLPSDALWLDVDDAQGFSVLCRRVEESLAALRARPPALCDLIARTPLLASRAKESAHLGVALDGVAAPTGVVATLSIGKGAASLIVDGARISDSDARDWAKRIARLALRLAADPERPLRTVDLLTDAEREQVVFAWNATARSPVPDERMHDRFEGQVDRRPQSLAVVFESQRATYAELEARANRIAHTLIARGAAPGKFVAFCLPRGIDMVAAMIGIAKTGAAYVPIDVGYPRERAAFMLDDAHALLVVTHDKLAERFSGRATVIADGAEVLRAPETRPPCRAAPHDVCYAIYTSGSTGNPKGVVLTHRAVVNTLDWVVRTFKVTDRDRLLFVTSPSFDLSVFDVFGALGVGAVVEIASPERLAEPALLARRLVEAGVTIWDSAPPALSRLVPFLPARAADSTLRLVMLSGDWVPVRLPTQLRAVFPDLDIKALGGATEAAIWSNWFDVGAVDPAWTSIPYGWPIDNARYMVLDRRLRALPPGISGDLVIGGACLAEGYLGRPELTAERFVPDPFRPGERIYKTGDLARTWADGTIEFLGRSDFQVKVRGYRVETGEVEVAMLALPGVRECAVVARVDASGEKVLVGYVVANEGATVDPAAARKELASRLPDFMVPSFVVVLPRLPLTANGKLDRAALPAPTGAGSARTAPRTPTERELSRIWTDILRRDAIGLTDSFFDLGGHSLLAVMFVTRMKETLGVSVPLSRLISHPTIEALAREIDGHRTRDGASEPMSLIPLRERGEKPPLFLIAGIGGHAFGMRDLALRLPDDQPVYAFRAIGAESGELPKESIEEIARAYERDVLAVAGTRRVVIGGYSFGALVAFELARRLRARGTRVERIVLIDAFAPGYPRIPWLPRRAVLHARRFSALDVRGKRDYLRARVKNVAARAIARAGLSTLLAPRVVDADGETQAQLRQLWGSLSDAQRLYSPGGPDAGPVTLFRAEQDPDWPGVEFDDDALGWRTWVTGPLEVIRMRGSHLDAFTPDNLDRIGRTLATRLK